MEDLILAPQEAEAIDKIKGEAEKITAKAEMIAKVIDAPTEARAVEFLSQIKMRHNIIETARTKLVKPLNDHVKMINAEFKLTTKPLEEAEARVKQGMTAYRNSQEFKEAEAKRLEIEEQGRAAVRAGDTETLSRLADEHDDAKMAAPKTVNTQSGQGRFRKAWKFEIQDLEKLPAAFWMPNEKKIEATIKAGISVPGVKAWQEDIPVIYNP